MSTDPNKCFSCKGPYHPDSGDYDPKLDIRRCSVCIRGFLDWLWRHQRRRWGKLDFYNEAITSIKPKG